MGCHQAAWNTTPSFGGNCAGSHQAGFPSTALLAPSGHTITKWADGKLDHTAFGFPLTNSHAPLVADGGKCRPALPATSTTITADDLALGLAGIPDAI